jgi:hypothetical protein
VDTVFWVSILVKCDAFMRNPNYLGFCLRVY